MSRGAGGEFSSFAARDWEKVCRDLLSLVNLYQRIRILNLDQILIMALLMALLKFSHGFALCYSTRFIRF